MGILAAILYYYFFSYRGEPMNPSVKFAISIPEREFRELEKIRKKEGLTRSRLVLEAITFWKSSREKEKLIRVYEEGYRRHPQESF